MTVSPTATLANLAERDEDLTVLIDTIDWAFEQRIELAEHAVAKVCAIACEHCLGAANFLGQLRSGWAQDFGCRHDPSTVDELPLGVLEVATCTVVVNG